MTRPADAATAPPPGGAPDRPRDGAPERSLDRALDPAKVAVFGASRTPGKMGYLLVEQLLAHRFGGEIALVNPRGGDWNGLPLLGAETATGADVAVLALPAGAVVATVEQCADLGIGTVVVLTAGFAEEGHAGRQEALREVAARRGVRVLGPNCLGFYSSRARLNLTTLPELPPGSVSLVSQSGGVVSHLSRRFKQLGDGFDAIVTLGNRMDVGVAEAVRTLARRGPKGSALLYLESFDEGDALLDAIADYAGQRPVVVLLGGRSASGRAAAMSHTASMIGSWERNAALLAEAGAKVASSLEHAAAAACFGTPARSGRRVFALCDGGGHAVLLGDALEAAGLELGPPPAEPAAELRAMLSMPEAKTMSNPLDFAGAADSDLTLYSRAVELVAASGAYDSIVVGGTFGGYAELFGGDAGAAELAIAGELHGSCTRWGLPLAMQTAYAGSASPAVAALRQAGRPVFDWPSEAAAWLAAQIGPASADAPDTVAVAAAGAGAADSSDSPAAELRPELSEHTEQLRRVCLRLGAEDGIGGVTSRDELGRCRDGRWVLRLDGVPHKVRHGAIEVGVPGPEVPVAYENLVARAGALGLEPVIRVAPLFEHDHELLITLWNSPSDGKGLVLGGGGSAVERDRDVVVGRLPRRPADVVALLRRTGTGRAVLSAASPAVVDRFAGFTVALAGLLDTELSHFGEIEFNPVALSADHFAVLDTLPTPRAVRNSREALP